MKGYCQSAQKNRIIVFGGVWGRAGHLKPYFSPILHTFLFRKTSFVSRTYLLTYSCCRCPRLSIYNTGPPPRLLVYSSVPLPSAFASRVYLARLSGSQHARANHRFYQYNTLCLGFIPASFNMNTTADNWIVRFDDKLGQWSFQTEEFIAVKVS